MEKMLFKSYFSEEIVDRLTVEYQSGNLAVTIQLWSEEEPLATLTVDFGNDAGNQSVVMPFCGWLDTNNCPNAEAFIARYDLGKPLTRFGEPVWMYSGYCRYPYYQFNAEKLLVLDPDGSKAYRDNWDRSCKKAVRKVCCACVR